VTPAPTQSQVQASLRSFLLAVLPATAPDGSAVEVVAAQQNRVPEVKGTAFVVMTRARVERIATNVDAYSDAVFTGSIAGNTMTITAVDPRFPAAQIAVGSTIFGVGVAAGTTVTAIVTGTGQVGTYTVSGAPQTVGSESLSAGTEQLTQEMRWTFQLDFHADPTNDISGDMATTISTLLRDDFGVQQFANQSPNYGVVPLYADDARQTPFFNDQQQVEIRWVVEAVLQSNAVVSVPQQFADSVAVQLISVDAAYPP
jgi:hypothetical protein